MRMKTEAKAKGRRLVKVASPFHTFVDGVYIYSVKPGERPGKKNQVAWFAQLPKSCCC